MLTDLSEDYIETWNFLSRRIENVIDVGLTLNSSVNFAKASFDGFINILSLFNIPPSNNENDISKIRD
jgi:hypothetical protein